MPQIRILGLDISSTTIGWCILDIIDQKIVLVKYDYYKPNKNGHIISRLYETKKFFNKLFKEYKPNQITIEEIIQYMSGASSATTIITLTSFNRALGLLSYEYLKQLPTYYSVMSIRHGLKLSKELPAKEDMPTLVEYYLDIKFNYLYNSKGKIKPETYDMSDACSVAINHALKILAPNPQPKIIRKTNAKK